MQRVCANSIALIDPHCKGGKVLVPVAQLHSTRGLTDWERGFCHGRDMSVCCLFQDNRCKAGSACRQIHVDHAFMAALRAQHKDCVSCCFGCGDTASQAPTAKALFTQVCSAVSFVELTGPATVGMPTLHPEELGYTAGISVPLQSAIHTGKFVVDWSTVCRLHLKASCKYGKDCKNVHICCKLGPQLLARAAANVNRNVSVDVTMRARECDALQSTRMTPPESPLLPSRTATPPPPMTESCSRSASVETVAASANLAERRALQKVKATAELTGWFASRCVPEARTPSPKPRSHPVTPPTAAKPFEPATPKTPSLPQPAAPAFLRPVFPTLDEGSLKIADADLHDLCFDFAPISVASTTTLIPSTTTSAATTATKAKASLFGSFGRPGAFADLFESASPASTVASTRKASARML